MGANVLITRAATGRVATGTYRLLVAMGGISGGYDSLSGDLVIDAPFLDFALYAGSDAIDLARSDLAFADVVKSRSARATGAALVPRRSAWQACLSHRFICFDDVKKPTETASPQTMCNFESSLPLARPIAPSARRLARNVRFHVPGLRT